MGKKNTTPYVNKALHIFTASPAPTLWIWITLWPRLHQAVPFCSTFKPSRCQHRDRRANRETNLTTQCGPANGCISQRSWAKNKKKKACPRIVQCSSCICNRSQNTDRPHFEQILQYPYLWVLGTNYCDMNHDHKTFDLDQNQHWKMEEKKKGKKVQDCTFCNYFKSDETSI